MRFCCVDAIYNRLYTLLMTKCFLVVHLPCHFCMSVSVLSYQVNICLSYNLVLESYPTDIVYVNFHKGRIR